MENAVRGTFADDGTATVRLLGEIDFTNAGEVSQGIRDAIAQWAPPRLLVELAEATFIDSTGLGALIEGYRAAVESGSRFVVVNPTQSFHRVLTVTGLCGLFGLDEPAAGTAMWGLPAPAEATGS